MTLQAIAHFEWCWLAKHGVWEGEGLMLSCDGFRPIKAHLISRQTLLREISAEFSAGLVWDDAVWVWACGGNVGVTGHHGHFDTSRKLRVPRAKIPRATEEFAKRWGLEWWLDRTYGERIESGV